MDVACCKGYTGSASPRDHTRDREVIAVPKWCMSPVHLSAGRGARAVAHRLYRQVLTARAGELDQKRARFGIELNLEPIREPK